MAAVNDKFPIFSHVQLSSSEASVASYLLAHLDEVGTLRVKDVSDACFTSTTTVVRLAKKLGFKGFSELAFALERVHRSNGNQRQTATELGDNAERFRSLLSRDRHIFLFGEGWSMLVTEYMERKFSLAGYSAITRSYLDTDTLLDSRDISIAIMVSKSGYTADILEAARKCHDHAIPVAAFTGNRDSDIARVSDMLFVEHDDAPLDTLNQDYNLFYSRCIALFEMLFKGRSA